ncbi:MAG TPA: cytochrome c [Chthoniobacterales bacterium]|jgi:mono/diheme cytochrome c family protein|nr:cytochrome c [Chthoniobacterales bacterium]
MSKFLLGLILGIALLMAAEYLFVAQGGLYMGTKGNPLPMEQHLANKAIAASIGQSAREESPVSADETNLLAGAHIYQQGCAGCHGRLDQDPGTMSKRFYPSPPQLLPPGKGVTDDPVGATHWVVKNGIRFSAMPAAGKLTDQEIWQVSQFLHNADKLPASVQEFLRQKE